MSPPRCNFSTLKLQENSRVDDDLRYSIDRLDNLRFAEEEDRSQKLDLDKIRKSRNNSNYTNPNLDRIIKCNVINTSFHSTSSQFPQKRPNSLTYSNMGFFPPNMYIPQINMIRKPFVLNKEKLRQDFNSPKYENRRKEFFATFSDFLRSYIRDKYYEFMNDIQTEVNFFAWFDHYFKPKLLADRNNNLNNLLHKGTIQKTKTDNSLLQKEKEVIKNSFLQLPSSISSPDNSTSIVTKQRCLTSQNKPTIHTPPNSQTLTKTHASDTVVSSHVYRTSHKSLNTKDKNSSHQISNFPCTKTHSLELSDTRQTLMVINNANQQNNKKPTILSQIGQINTIKKDKKDKKKLKEEKKDISSLSPTKIGSPTKCNKDKKKKDITNLQTITKNSEEKANHKPICYKCNKPGHYQNNCKPPKNKSKLNTPELHSEINSLKQEIQEIKNSSF